MLKLFKTELSFKKANSNLYLFKAFKSNAELVYPLEYISHTSFGLNTSGLYTTLAIKPENPGTWYLSGVLVPPIKIVLEFEMGDATVVILHVFINLPSM